jgi:peptidoglycan/LPS O-acetylase OafA/YrhL
MNADPKHRLREIDFLRGIAVALMVFTHTAMYFYDFSNGFLNRISDLGGEICLSIFLFCSGFVLPGLISRYGGTQGSMKMARRAVQMFVVYLLFGIILSGPQNIWMLLSFQNIPAFADFTLAFALFFLLAAFLGEFITTHNHALIALGVSVVLYLLGYYLYNLSAPEYLLPIKALLVGEGEWHRFPIFQYSLIYMLGLNYYFWHEKINLRIVAAVAVIASIAATLLSVWGFTRWSVSPSFLLHSIAAIAILLLVWRTTERLHPHLPPFVQAVKDRLVTQLHYFSKHALNILLLHVLILTLLSQTPMPKLQGALLLLAYLIILPSSLWLSGKLDRAI